MFLILPCDHGKVNFVNEYVIFFRRVICYKRFNFEINKMVY